MMPHHDHTVGATTLTCIGQYGISHHSKRAHEVGDRLRDGDLLSNIRSKRQFRKARMANEHTCRAQPLHPTSFHLSLEHRVFRDMFRIRAVQSLTRRGSKMIW